MEIRDLRDMDNQRTAKCLKGAMIGETGYNRAVDEFKRSFHRNTGDSSVTSAIVERNARNSNVSPERAIHLESGYHVTEKPMSLPESGNLEGAARRFFKHLPS